MAEVEIGRSWIEPSFNAQRPAGLLRLDQPLAQLIFPDQIRQTLFQVGQLFVDGHLLNGKQTHRSDSSTIRAVNSGLSIGMKCEYADVGISRPCPKLDASSGAAGDLALTSDGSA